MDENTRFEKDVDISVKLFEMANECEDAGMQVENLFLSSIAASFAMGKSGLNTALLIYGKEMISVADIYVNLLKNIVNRSNDDKDN